MHRIDTAGAQNGQFVDKDPANGIPGTVVDDAWLNSVQEEIVTLINEAGLTLDKAKKNQLSAAVGELISKPSFDLLPKQNPIAPEITNKPVFALFNQANFDQTYILYPCLSGDKCVLETYEIGGTAADDTFNVGGTGNHRVTESFVIKKAVVGQLNPFARTAGVTEGNFISSSNWEAAIGAPTSSAGSGSFANGANGFVNQVTYNIPDAAEEIEFYATDNSEILFYRSGSSSTAVEIYVDISGTYTLIDTIDLSDSGAYRYSVSAETKVKIRNTQTANCYVIGVDVDDISNANLIRIYDSVKYWREDDYSGSVAYWIGPSEGANDFAWKDTEGRFFGSYHGGHSTETVSLIMGGETLVSGDVVAGEFRIGRTATLKSDSTLTSDSATYSCLSEVTYFQGGHRIFGEITTASPVPMDEMFMGMTCANIRFSAIELPKTLDLSDTSVDDETILGDVNHVIQVDPTRGHMLRTDVTRFDNRYAAKPGPYIQTRSNDYKFYNNPLEDSGKPSSGASFEVYHRFYS